jgi:hypothetical protein
VFLFHPISLGLPHFLPLHILILQIPDLFIFLRYLILINLLKCLILQWWCISQITLCFVPSFSIHIALVLLFLITVIQSYAPAFQEPQLLGSQRPRGDLVLAHEAFVVSGHSNI